MGSMDSRDDIHGLFLKAKSGDEKAENQLLTCIAERFEEYHGHKLGNRQDLKDLQQELCMIVSRKYKTESFTKGFEFWLAGVMRKVLQKHWDRKGKEGKIQNAVKSNPERVPKPADLSLDPELVHRLRHCMELLCRKNRRYARAVCLTFHDKSVAGIAEAMNTTISNVYTILSRGRDQLWDCLWSNEI
jgi:RNA polymerase sigma factor (sigma-70 family)